VSGLAEREGLFHDPKGGGFKLKQASKANLFFNYRFRTHLQTGRSAHLKVFAASQLSSFYFPPRSNKFGPAETKKPADFVGKGFELKV
jgi:hypothetical protein